MRGDQPLLTAGELQTHLHRFIALDYHRTPHRGLKLPGLTTARLTPLEMFDALLEATGRIHVAQHGDLVYQFLPQRWLTPGHSGVEYRGLSYDGPALDGLRGQRSGTFRAQDDKVPFLYDPRDVTRLWHRSRDDGRIHELTWKSAHLVHAPLGAVVRDRALVLIKARGGNDAVSARLVKRQIIDEITDLTSTRGPEEWRAQMSAARLRWEQARSDHAEADTTTRTLEEARAHGLPRIPRPPVESGDSRAGQVIPGEPSSDDEPWPDYDEVS